MEDSGLFDPGKGAAPAAPKPLMDRLMEKIREAGDLQNLVEQLEADLSAARSSLHKIRTGSLPEIMAEARSTDLTTGDWNVKVSDFVSGSLPKAQKNDGEDRAKALEYLERQQGGSPLIKTKFTVSFGKSEREIAKHLQEYLESQGYEFTAEVGVNAASLQKFVREGLENGQPIDPDKLGLFTGKIAKLKYVGSKEEDDVIDENDS